MCIFDYGPFEFISEINDHMDQIDRISILVRFQTDWKWIKIEIREL